MDFLNYVLLQERKGDATPSGGSSACLLSAMENVIASRSLDKSHETERQEKEERDSCSCSDPLRTSSTDPTAVGGPLVSSTSMYRGADGNLKRRKNKRSR